MDEPHNPVFSSAACRHCRGVVVGTALLSAVLGGLWMIVHEPGGRATDVGVLWLVKLVFIAREFDPSAFAPFLLDQYRDFQSGSRCLTFLWISATVQALLAVGLGFFFLLPGLSASARRLSVTRFSRLARRDAMLGLAVTLLASPLVIRPTLDLYRDIWPWEHPVRWGLACSGLLLAGSLAAAVKCLGRLERIRRFKVATLTAGLLVPLVGSVGLAIRDLPKPSATADSLNVLLISIDTLRRDHLSAYGYSRPTSPNVDALADEGVRFETVVSASSWTIPSHMTLLTAMPPLVHQVTGVESRLDSRAVTLAEVFSAQGYDTAGFVSGPTLRAEYGFAQGFDYYDDFTAATTAEAPTSPRMLSVVRTWLERRVGDGQVRPFFLFLHLWDVHANYEPPPPYDREFDPDFQGTVSSDPHLPLGITLSDAELRHLIALYDGEILYTDHYLGELFELLRELGKFDQTLIAVTADHGEEFLEHDGFTHHRTLYDEVLLVPLVLRLPGRLPVGKVIREQVRSMDLPPTLLELAGVQSDSFQAQNRRGFQDARSLVPLIETGVWQAPPAYSEMDDHLYSVRSPSRKLIVDLRTGSVQLYDLPHDSAERRNLAAIPGTDLEAARQLIRELFADRGKGFGQRLVPDAEQTERLRSLGYVR